MQLTKVLFVSWAVLCSAGGADLMHLGWLRHDKLVYTCVDLVLVR